jgi:hypothetical protein
MTGWQPIESAPVTGRMTGMRVLVWSEQLGIHTAGLHRWENSPPIVNVSAFHGDAVEHWGVTHWMPLPDPPAEGS